MKTPSFKTAQEIDSLQSRLHDVGCALTPLLALQADLLDALQEAHDSFKQQRDEETLSRRTYVPSKPGGLRAPHAGPSARWQASRSTLEHITNYIYTPGRTERQKMLAFRLSSACTIALNITNTQCWNPRNPSPHLP